MEEVTWYMAAAYCNALSSKAGLTACYACTGSGSSVTCKETSATMGKGIYACKGFRLPTEAEWEYAYRAGTSTAFYNGSITNCTNADPNAAKIGWYCMNSAVKYSGCVNGKDAACGGDWKCLGTHPVGQKTPNAWGLYGMAGNVAEWCHDGHQYQNLGAAPVTDPVVGGGSDKVMRGGAVFSSPDIMRAARRTSAASKIQFPVLGFRCSRTIK